MRWRPIRSRIIITLVGGLIAVLVLIAPVRAVQQQDVTITSREIVERLARLEEGLKRLETQLTQRIDGVESNLNRRIDELRQLILWGFGITFAGIFALMGFVIWDRRTALTPAVRRIDDLQDRQQRIEKALQELSRENPKLAENLRNLGLL